MEFSLKVCLGFLFGLFSGASLFLNLLALFSVFQLTFIQRKNQVYIIAFFNILSDAIQMTLATFYLSPSIITSSYLVGTQKKQGSTIILGSLFLYLWYFETITQIVMAVNRLVVICFRNNKVFTFFSTSVLFVFLIPLIFLFMYFSQFLYPCCTFLFDQEYLSYSYSQIEGVPNYSDRFDVLINTTSSVISSACYVWIFWTFHKSSANSNKNREQAQKSKMKKDIKYAIQFSVLLFFYTFSWASFHFIFPFFLANRNIEWFIMTPMLYSINCTTNSIIYILFNPEVQNLLPEKVLLVLRKIGIARSPKIFQIPKNQSVSVSTGSKTNPTSSRPTGPFFYARRNR